MSTSNSDILIFCVLKFCDTQLQIVFNIEISKLFLQFSSLYGIKLTCEEFTLIPISKKTVTMIDKNEKKRSFDVNCYVIDNCYFIPFQGMNTKSVTHLFSVVYICLNLYILCIHQTAFQLVNKYCSCGVVFFISFICSIDICVCYWIEDWLVATWLICVQV